MTIRRPLSVGVAIVRGIHVCVEADTTLGGWHIADDEKHARRNDGAVLDWFGGDAPINISSNAKRNRPRVRQTPVINSQRKTAIAGDTQRVLLTKLIESTESFVCVRV